MMKKILPLLIALCACLMISCGNSEVDKINQLVVEATEKTANAESLQEIVEIARTLQEEMDKITSESGNKVSIGKSVTESLDKYQEVVAEKLSEFSINTDVE